MNLSKKFAALKIKTPLHKAFPRRVPPIEFTSTKSDNNDLNGHVKAKKPLKQPCKILQIKKSKFQDNAVYYSSDMEYSDGEQDDSDSEMEEKRRIAGETDGLATSKKKPGRKKFNSDDDTPTTDSATHPYLQNEDGSLVSPEQLGVMSQKARRIWIAFKKEGEAPTTWGQISTDLHDYYVQEMVSDPKFLFLRYCDDGEWKLLEWTRKSYSSWTLSNGLREKKSKKLSESLDNPDLLQISSNESTPFLAVEEIPQTSIGFDPPAQLFFVNPLSETDRQFSVGNNDIHERESEPVMSPGTTTASSVTTLDTSIHGSSTAPSPLMHNRPSSDLASGVECAPDAAQAAQPAPLSVITLATPALENAATASPSASSSTPSEDVGVPNAATASPSASSSTPSEDVGVPGDGISQPAEEIASSNTSVSESVTGTVPAPAPIQSTVSKKRPSTDLEAQSGNSTSQTEAGTSTTTASTVTITSAAKKRKISEDTLAVPSKACSDRNYCMIDWCMRNAGGKLYKFSEHWESLSTDERKVRDSLSGIQQRTDVNNKLFKRQADAASLLPSTQ
ncbi:hypothetical protein M378DRAFT_182359 [Amanita muscaria Koide BX008]|uniref:Uncharacterized protein n=1 Tax=Amanita muscaria (strain Koide BX008) TaxID=946122 RepID=A0A0C2WEH3_AMAMK|nr:hypothetical protein M378DRAFT_182359 [Amanita muscaria Koide BX008]